MLTRNAQIDSRAPGSGPISRGGKLPLASRRSPPYHPIMEISSEIAVIGPGAAGLSAAIGLAQAGYQVTLAGPADLRQGTRTVALFEGSLRFLEALGLRDRVEAAGQPLAVMHIADDTVSPFRRPPVSFRASEIGVEAFGYNVENSILVALLLEKARSLKNITRLEHFAQDYRFEDDRVQISLANGTRIQTRLLVAADGAKSPARKAAGIKTQTWDYNQTALTAVLGHDFDHENISVEYHTRQGPCTFVPLPAQDGARHASSLVWLMSQREAARRAELPAADMEEEITDAAHFNLGEMRLLRPIKAYPIRGLAARRLTGNRIALAGESAHVLPPIGAQGLNLGFRDAAHLCETLSATDGATLEDPGASEILDTYASKRQMDVASRTFGVDLLNRALLNHMPHMDLLRGIGVSALAGIGPLRRRIMQEGMSPQTGAPHVMRNRSATSHPRRKPSTVEV